MFGSKERKGREGKRDSLVWFGRMRDKITLIFPPFLSSYLVSKGKNFNQNIMYYFQSIRGLHEDIFRIKKITKGNLVQTI